ncbi:MAG: ABC transporter permease [Planctomycetes bacterium]|nr:ABC transporter permease [Planctomycetota bacterium]
MLERIVESLENLTLNPLRSVLTMLGVIIGVFAVITLVSIGEGAKRYVTDQLTGLGTNVLIITPGATMTSGGPPLINMTHKLTAGDADAIRQRCPTVSHVAPVILATSSIKYRNRVRANTPVIGTVSEFQIIRNMYVQHGTFLPPREVRGEDRLCVLGVKVVQDLFEGEENPLGKWVRIADSNYRVIGIMERKGVSLGFDIDTIVFVPVHAAQETFDTDALFEIIARTADTGRVEQSKEEVTAVLKRRHATREDFTVTDQSQMLDALAKILDMLTYALAGIAAISLLVGGIGIMNIMLVSVGEKTREIGIRKAVGATRADILAQFLIESLTLSLLGGALGMALGVGLSLLVGWYFPSFPIVIRPWSVALAVGFSMAVGLFFGVYPARRAAMLDPIEALQCD